MWNSWVENAKAMAADLDSKINESVGMDSSGNPIAKPVSTSSATPMVSTPSKSTSIPISSFETPLAATPTPAAPSAGNAIKIEDDGDDAWNDDFDFDDGNFEEDSKTVENTTSPSPKPTEPVVVPIPESTPTPAKPAPTKTIPKTTTIPLPVPTPVVPTGESPEPSPVPTPVVPPEESPKPSPVPTPVVLPKESPKPPPPLEPDTDSATLSHSEDAPNEASPPAIEEIPALSSCAENETIDDTECDGEDDLDTKLNDDTTTEKTITVPSSPAITKDPTTSTATPASNGDGMSSNLSNTAKADNPMLTPNKDKDVEDDQKGASESTDQIPDSKPKEKPIPKTTPVLPPKTTPKPKAATNTPKYTPGGSLFSRMTNLAQTADSLLTAAVEQSTDIGGNKIFESSEPASSGGWDEDNDDDFFNDDEQEDEVVDEPKIEKLTDVSTTDTSAGSDPDGKGKTSVESTDSFVKVSPTSSIHTPDIINQTPQEVPDMPKFESENDKPDQADSPALGPKEVETTKSKPSTIPVAVTANIEDDPRYQKLQEALRQREEQLIDRGTQLNELQLLLETRDEQYKKKLSETKEEAKKRILRAKERCEAAEAKLSARSSAESDDVQKKQLIIDELMEEGQALAKKQSVMERAVRDATAETRALSADLQQEIDEKEEALEKIKKLEATCKSLNDSLASARKGESQAGQLENDLLSARADAEEKSSTILSLQQRLKELTAESKDLQREIDETRKSAAHEAQQEKTSMRKEHNDLIGDLEQKLRTTEREAGVREDALRHEISEIRKRWQDSVRRADALSMDIQSSTAPLMRQLESMERQSRLRATNSAELEAKLRSDLEEAVNENDRLCKESSEFRSKLSRLERSMKDRDHELSKAQSTLAEQATDLENLRNQEEKLIAEAEARQIEYEKVERLANEGVVRVRSEMSQAVKDSEERYRGQIDKLQNELTVEKDKRNQLEQQVGQLLESGGALISTSPAQNAIGIKRESKPKKLHRAENQAEILAGALGLGDDSSDDDSHFESDDDDGLFDGEGHGSEGQPSSGGYHSFAAIEQLSSKLKTSEVELKSMRKSLKESNEIRQSLVEELGEARAAKEKLPLFEAKVKELTKENTEMELEIAGLKEDIADVRDLYRTQLNVLLEEKSASASLSTNTEE